MVFYMSIFVKVGRFSWKDDDIWIVFACKNLMIKFNQTNKKYFCKFSKFIYDFYIDSLNIGF